MTAPRDLLEEVGRALEATPRAGRPVSGGCINEAYLVDLEDGRRVFVKSSRDAHPELFPVEARGLAWLEEAGALRVPQPLAVSSPGGPVPFLVLEYLEPGARRRGFDEELGRGLAALHRTGAPFFGLDHTSFLGPLPQDNRPVETWPAFYRERRLRPMAARAGARLDRRVRRGLDRLFERLEDLAGPPEPPARLHGDLWSGNVHTDREGRPVLLDPAVYGGHREVDLAMLRLFGGPGERCFRAYQEAFPLAPGHEERVPLYQLYPLLVHVVLFGGSYVHSLAAALERALAA